MSTGALLTIISGTPGAGKTSLAVKQIEDFLKREPGRPVFVMGIPELAFPHEPVPPVTEWTVQRTHPDDPSLVYPEFTFPDGALIVLDEAQNVFRPRTSGSKVPDYVAAMERHRHKGLDFILITQHPSLIDGNIRRLCGKYWHIRSMWSGRKLYEWAECVNPDSVTDRDRAAVTNYRLPKSIFGKYKSASMHVKQSRRIPKAFFVVLVGLGLASWMGYRMWDRVTGFIAGGEDAVTVTETVQPSAVQMGQGRVTPGGGSLGAAGAVASVGTSIQDYQPRMPQRPETAPLYDALRTPRAMPVVAGCVSMGSRCRCYTQQGTDAFLTDAQCQGWLASPPFNPYAEPDRVPAKLASGARSGDASEM